MAQEQCPACVECGAPVLDSASEPSVSEPVVAPHCPACAAAGRSPATPRPEGLDRAAILMSVCLFVLAVSALADVLAFGSHAGFGWRQGLGLGFAGVLVLTGAMMRISTLFAIGLIVGLLTLLADWLGFGDAPGFGWQQTLGSLLGAALIAMGLLVRGTSTRDD